jgi:stage II sporulation protein M
MTHVASFLELREGFGMSFNALWRHFLEMKHYFIAVTLVFAAGIYLGYAQADQFQAYLQEQLGGLRQLVELVESKDNKQLWFFILIFLNNTLKSIFIVFSGAFLGIMPLFFLVANGMILGYLAAIQPAGELWSTFMLGIVPHGIIEIPAILLASAYGLRFGTIIVKNMVNLVRPQKRGSEELQQFVKLTIPLMVVLTVSLLVAAGIESTLTLWLLQK